MIKHITPVRPEAARGLVRDVYRQIKGDFGAVVDPFAVHSVSPPLLAAVWSACRESQLVGDVPREIKEAIAVTVSMNNQCPFCVDAHMVMLHAVNAHNMADALAHDRVDRLSEQSRSVLAWAGATGHRQSNGSRPPCSAAEAPEMIGTAVFYHYMNRICTVLLDDTPLPSSNRWLKGFFSRVAGWYFSFAAHRPKPPGASLAFLPDADLPDDMSWAAASDRVSAAWARLAREVDCQARAALPQETIEFCSDQIRHWEGGTNGGSREAIANVVRQLRPDQQSAGQLVLLTAIAPRHVDEPAIRGFVDPTREPEKLLAALAWASFTAARGIGARMHSSPDPCENAVLNGTPA